MTNHVHLLLSVDEPAGLSQLMRYVGSRYVQRINRVHERCGTLWESRFRSSIVQTEKHLMACYRYIELNPVRAGMVEHPADYPWSSCIGHVTGARNDLLEDHVVFLELGMSDTDRAAGYGDLLNEPLARDLIERIRSSVYGGLALGEGTEPVSSIRAASPSTAVAVP
jgi:putative transposase